MRQAPSSSQQFQAARSGDSRHPIELAKPGFGKDSTMMRMNGRFEARTQLTLPLYVQSIKAPACADLALTENVSPRGARIVTKRSATVGEWWQLSTLSPGEPVLARVVYCEQLSHRSFCIGLEMRQPIQHWWTATRLPVRGASRTYASRISIDRH